MSVQEALRIAGVLSCCMAAALAALAAYAFVKQDIPGVLDDLSGRRRQRALAATLPLPPFEETEELPSEPLREVTLRDHDVATEVVANEWESAKTRVCEPCFDVVFSVVLCDAFAAQ